MFGRPLQWLLSPCLTKTRFGLRLGRWVKNRNAGRAGVSVAKTRYFALIIAGVLCGIAGAYLSTAHGSGFVREMTAGKGYIALAAMILVNGNHAVRF